MDIPKITNLSLQSEKSPLIFDPSFPTDLNNLIFEKAIVQETLQEAARSISTLIQINKASYCYLNNKDHCLEIIKKLSLRFDCSNEDVAQHLQNSRGKYQYYIQCSLFHIIQNNDIIHMKTLLSKWKCDGADLNFTYGDDCQTPLMQSLGYPKSNIALAQWLIQNDADLNIIDKDGWTFYSHICYDPRILEDLIKHPQFDINFRDGYGRTALMYLIRHLNTWENPNAYLQWLLDGIKDFLMHGANPMIADNEKQTALDYARKNKYHVLDLLQEEIQKKHQ